MELIWGQPAWYSPCCSCCVCSFLIISCTVFCSLRSSSFLYCVRSLWSSPVLCPQSLVISCTVSTVSGHLFYCVRSLWSSPVLCPQSLLISCTVSTVSGHSCTMSAVFWSSPVLCLQSLVISCTMSAVSGHLLLLCLQSLLILLYYVCKSL
ncbi:unnamed protein product, partial [Staurois parvus]